ncbi:MAG TPA: hypothetical protein ENL03_02335, partial [Phycisphaerae bacterium]|nr:hypothetical protein [Phycisphaerae bacterium]
MKPIRVAVTIDLENPQTPLFEKRFSDNRIWSDGWGVEKIIDLLDAYGVVGSFFTNVYESAVWGRSEMERICRTICDAGHHVELHTHPIWIDEKRRENMFQLPLFEQQGIVEWGADFIERCTSRRPVCHRAGAYGFNRDTLRACDAAGIAIDSSNYMGHKLCRTVVTGNEIVRAEGVWELPVTFIRSAGQCIKTDLDWIDEKSLRGFVDAARVDENQNFLNFFFHSYSLTATSDGFKTFQPDHGKVRKLESILQWLTNDAGCEVVPLAQVVPLDGESKPEVTKRPEIIPIETVAVKPTIAFVKLNPQMRIYKQAQALKETGRYRLVLVANRYDRELFEPVFDEIIDFGTDEALKQYCARKTNQAGLNRSILTANQLADVLRRLAP